MDRLPRDLSLDLASYLGRCLAGGARPLARANKRWREIMKAAPDCALLVARCKVVGAHPDSRLVVVAPGCHILEGATSPGARPAWSYVQGTSVTPLSTPKSYDITPVCVHWDRHSHGRRYRVGGTGGAPPPAPIPANGEMMFPCTEHLLACEPPHPASALDGAGHAFSIVLPSDGGAPTTVAALRGVWAIVGEDGLIYEDAEGNVRRVGLDGRPRPLHPAAARAVQRQFPRNILGLSYLVFGHAGGLTDRYLLLAADMEEREADRADGEAGERSWTDGRAWKAYDLETGRATLFYSGLYEPLAARGVHALFGVARDQAVQLMLRRLDTGEVCFSSKALAAPVCRKAVFGERYIACGRILITW